MKDFIVKDYFLPKGFLKILSILFDKVTYFIDSNAHKRFRTSVNTILSLEKIKKKTNFPLNKYDKGNYYIKNSVIGILNLWENNYTKVGLYQEPLRFLSTYLASLYGHIRLANNNNLRKLDQQYNILRNQNVLIIGTGPSMKKIDIEFLNFYDHIFLLNKAIINYEEIKKMTNSNKTNFSFYCCDRNRIYEVKDNLNKSDIPKIRRVFFPDYPMSILRSDLAGIEITILGGDKPWRNAYCGYGKGNLHGWHMLYTNTPIDIKEMKIDLNNRICKSGPNPYIPYSTVFSCISFIAGYEPLNIDLIGCDFSGNFADQPMDLTFNAICKNLSENNINCSNKS